MVLHTHYTLQRLDSTARLLRPTTKTTSLNFWWNGQVSFKSMTQPTTYNFKLWSTTTDLGILYQPTKLIDQQFTTTVTRVLLKQLMFHKNLFYPQYFYYRPTFSLSNLWLSMNYHWIDIWKLKNYIPSFFFVIS